MRRARNLISRRRDLAAAAADLYDAGASDKAVAEACSKLAGAAIRPATAAAFRQRDYARIEQERVGRREAAAKVELILSGAAGTYAKAGQEILARLLYEMISGSAEMSPRDLIGAGKTFAKIREIEISQFRAELEAQKSDLASKAAKAAASGTADMTPAEREQKIREALGLA